MNRKIKFGFIFFVSASLVSVGANAQEKNYGKEKPTAESVIEEFKAAPPDAGDATEEVHPSGMGTRGLKMIGQGHKQSKAEAHKGSGQSAANEKAISLEVLFDSGSANLSPEAKQQLAPVGGAMASDELKGLHYRIEGHTDVVGSEDFNLDLSRRRADAVKQFLIEQNGLSASAIEIVGKGKHDLADKNNPTSEANRRVKIVRLVN